MSTFDPNRAAPPGSGIFGLTTSQEQSKVVLIPVPFDATTSYHRGAAQGPAAIAEASHQIDLFDVETGRPYEAGIYLADPWPEIADWNRLAQAAATPVIEAGGADQGDDLATLAGQVNAIGEQISLRLQAQVTALLDQGKRVGVIGGDHSVPLGAILAHARRYPGMGVLHIDAHADLRRAYQGFAQSHASIMDNVLCRTSEEELPRLVQVAVRDLCEEEADRIAQSRGRVVLHHDAHLWQARHDGEPWARICDRIVADLPQDVYVSFDIDGLDPSLCPGTGTPVPGGLAFAEAVALLRAVVRSRRRIVGFDLTEVAPDPAGGDWNENVGARLLYKLIGHLLLTYKG